MQWSITHRSCWQWPEKVNKDQSSLPTLSGTLSGDVANLLGVYYSKHSLTFPQITGIQLYVSFTQEKTQPGQGIYPPYVVSHLFTYTLTLSFITGILPRSLPLNAVPYYVYPAEISVKTTSTASRTSVQCPDFYGAWSQQDEVPHMQGKNWGDILF